MTIRSLLFRTAGWMPLVAAVVLVGCGGGPPPAGGPPPMPVEVVVLEPRPLESATEFIATVRSRRATTLQPMVEGFVTRIAVKSGDRVRAGDPILEIDGSRQRAAVAGLESVRAARAADVEQARRETERQKALLAAGAASARDAEQAQTALETAQALLAAAEEQIRAERVDLAYHRVTAPTGGVVGDLPVRVGDSVTRSTVLTTIDTGGGLELYLHIPVQSAGRLARGLAVHVIDDDGTALASTAIDFVSPQVDDATQTVLAKAPLPMPGRVLNQQQVRARIVWSATPGLAVPVVSVARVGGRTFAYVVEEAEGKTVARQRTVRLGPIVGNDYVVLDGLAAGDRLIVSGIQKIREGAPVTLAPPPPPQRG